MRKCGKQLPKDLTKIFSNGSKCYFIIDHINGSIHQMLEHFLDLLDIGVDYIDNPEFTDRLELSHPNFLEGLSITGEHAAGSSKYYYFIKSSIN